MVMGLILILSILCACVPVHRFHTASQLILLASTTMLFPTAVGCIVWTQGMSVGVAVVAYSVFFLIAHLVLVVQSRYAQIEKWRIACYLHCIYSGIRNYDGCRYG